MEWENYKAKIDFIEDFYWQQSVRKQSVRNLQFFYMAMKIIFTEHAEGRLEKRKFSKTEIIEAINFPDKTLKKYEKYYYQKTLERGKVEIICEKTEKHIKVITLYWL